MGWFKKPTAGGSGATLYSESFAGLNDGGTTILNVLVAPAHAPQVLASWELHNETGDIIVQGATYPIAGNLGRVICQVPNSEVDYLLGQSVGTISVEGTGVRIKTPTGIVPGNWTLYLQYWG